VNEQVNKQAGVTYVCVHVFCSCGSLKG